MRAFAFALPPLTALLLLAAGGPAPAQQGLAGHGGPVRALAATPDGAGAISGGFDQSAIVWDLVANRARRILRVHEGSVNAVAALPDGRFLTAGEDGRVAVWAQGSNQPARIDKAHDAPIAALAVDAQRGLYATGGWDEAARLFSLADGRLLRTFEGHRGAVNGVAFLPGGGFATAGYDGALRLWSANANEPARVIETGAPLNALALLPDGDIAAGRADGAVLFFTREGALRAQAQAAEAPIIALAASPDGASLAAASPRGSVAVLDVREARVRFTLNGPGLPVWSLAYAPDGRVLLTGGGDRLVRRWDARTGEHVGAISPQAPGDELAAFAGERGADVFRACAICHTLQPGEDNRAGPTLHRIFGRKAGAAPGYDYSQAFRKLDLVWTPQTVSLLFELGPQAYTPGTKMPEQRVVDAQDRAALIDFLERATR